MRRVKKQKQFYFEKKQKKTIKDQSRFNSSKQNSNVKTVLQESLTQKVIITETKTSKIEVGLMITDCWEPPPHRTVQPLTTTPIQHCTIKES